MTKQLIDYVNALSMIVFFQSIEIENQQRLLDQNTETLLKCRDIIDGLVCAKFGPIERDAI